MDHKKTYEEPNTLVSFSPDVKVQQDQHEKMVVIGFLAALPSEYDSVKLEILSNPEISSFRETLSRILRTETSSSTPSSLMSNALVRQNIGESEKQQHRNSGPSGNSRRTSSRRVLYYYCHKSGHKIRDCKKWLSRN